LSLLINAVRRFFLLLGHELNDKIRRAAFILAGSVLLGYAVAQTIKLWH
jgi:hypothetical protein